MSTQTMSEQIALLKNIIANLRGQVEEADATLERIRTALEEESGAAKQETDFTRLRYESGKHPYTGHPAARSSMPELYYLLLLTVLTSAEATEAQWMHLYRVAAGAGYEQDVRDLLPAAHAITDEKIIECVESLHRDNLVNSFLLDAMLLSLLREESPAMLEYIAGLCTLMEVPPEAITETIQAAKVIAAQNRESYLETMTEADHLSAQESCCYLYNLDGKTIVSDLTQAKVTETEHLTILCVKVKNMKLNLDTWSAEKITFQDSFFENSTVESSQKEVAFIGCVFYEKSPDSESNHVQLYLTKPSILQKCTFNNIVSEQCVLDLFNTTVEHCTFSDCTVHDFPLLTFSNGTITASEFIRCRGYDYFALCDIKNATVAHCSFSHCEITASQSYTSLSILETDKGVSIKNCDFEYCSSTAARAGSNFIIYLQGGSTSKENSFNDCSCYKTVFI